MLGNLYQHLAKPVLFQFDPEMVHTSLVRFGEILGSSDKTKTILSNFYSPKDKVLSQKIVGIDFASPIGLAAGFDYEARLTQILPALGFGFETVGTITNLPCEGNPRPRLSRLPKSKSLLINKGFKNLGADQTIQALSAKKFSVPLGISLGKTNCSKINSLKESITDIITAFIKFEKANLGNSYYELNISCPNLSSPISFYPSKNLHLLLEEIDRLKINKPIFVKLPISESISKLAQMIQAITFHCPTGIIIGNLQKDRTTLNDHDAQTIKNLSGGLSGKPTFQKSNELISLAYRNFGQKLRIIGCGGVFCAQDAYLKICLGASLVELITGLVFMGPQLVSEINTGLAILLKNDGFKDLTEAIGSKNS